MWLERPALGPFQPALQLVPGLFPGEWRRPGHEAGRLPSVAEVKNECKYISDLLYAFMSCAKNSPEEYEEKPPKISVHLVSLWSSWTLALQYTKPNWRQSYTKEAHESIIRNFSEWNGVAALYNSQSALGTKNHPVSRMPPTEIAGIPNNSLFKPLLIHRMMNFRKHVQ